MTKKNDTRNGCIGCGALLLLGVVGALTNRCEGSLGPNLAGDEHLRKSRVFHAREIVNRAIWSKLPNGRESNNIYIETLQRYGNGDWWKATGRTECNVTGQRFRFVIDVNEVLERFTLGELVEVE